MKGKPRKVNAHVVEREPEQQPVYTMAIAVRMVEIPAYTIRWLEDHELVHPARTEGNQRLFCEEDIELLREIAGLLEEGVNLAGIRAIFRLKHQLEGEQNEQ